jgi:uncharacterized membrane protein YccF (DUF307 family)
LKLVPVALWPFGREIVPMSEVSAALGPPEQSRERSELEPPRN